MLIKVIISLFLCPPQRTINLLCLLLVRRGDRFDPENFFRYLRKCYRQYNGIVLSSRLCTWFCSIKRSGQTMIDFFFLVAKLRRLVGRKSKSNFNVCIDRNRDGKENLNMILNFSRAQYVCDEKLLAPVIQARDWIWISSLLLFFFAKMNLLLLHCVVHRYISTFTQWYICTNVHTLFIFIPFFGTKVDWTPFSPRCRFLCRVFDFK